MMKHYTLSKLELTSKRQEYLSACNKRLHKRWDYLLEPISEGTESLVYKHKNCAVRVRKAESAYFDHLYMRTPEAHIQRRLNKSFFVETSEYNNHFSIMELLGDALGTDKGIQNIEDISLLIKFLEKLPAQLSDAGVRFHDIHPGNILFSETRYKLIDCTFARFEEEEGYTLPDCLNCVYSPDDETAIARIHEEAIARSSNSQPPRPCAASISMH